MIRKVNLSRQLRVVSAIEFLSMWLREFHATKIALGHTQDDQAETVMMWMLRGAGTTGLAGMAHHRPPLFIRPFLGVSRRRILEYLEQRGISYRMDSSNANPRYLRNRIRQQLIPVLKQFNPNILGVLSRQSDILREETQYLEQVAESALDSVKLERNAPGMALQRGMFLRAAAANSAACGDESL